MGWKYEYPHIPILGSIKPTPRILLGQRIFWTEKRDGSNIAIWINEDKVQISSRNLIDASSGLVALVKRTEEYSKIVELLQEHPQYIIYVEACRKGKSVTRIETYEKDCLIVFDMYDKSAKKYLSYILVHQYCYHFKIPIVKLWGESRHRSIKNLLKMADEALEYCKEANLEGMVIKAYKVPKNISIYYKEYRKGLIQAKVKLDIPKPKKIRKTRGKPIYPPIPESEVMGAIDKAWQELGEEDLCLMMEWSDPACKKCITETYKIIKKKRPQIVEHYEWI